MIQLRECQTDLINAVADKFRQHRRVVAVAPTGFGKTVVFSEISLRAVRKGKRILIVAHRIEICNQISNALDRLGIRHGRIMRGHTMTDDPVQVAMIATIARRMDRIQAFDLLVIDECHHAVSSSYTALTGAWPTIKILGVTATPQRTDGKGLGAAFDAMVESIPMTELIALEYLAGYDYLAPPQVADFSAVKMRMGDYATDELSDAMDKAVVTGSAVAEYSRYLAPRPAIAFCVSIAHAEHVAEQFRMAGFRAESVDGTMDPDIRRDRIASIGDGRLNVLTSCDLISEGTDLPSVAGAILLRPTQSVAMFLQQVGRVLRPKPDKSRAIILDHVGNVGRHGLPDMPRKWTLDTKKAKPPIPGVSTCKSCFQVFPFGTKGEPCPDKPMCLFASRPNAAPREIETVEGELKILSPETLAAMRAAPLHKILTGRETRDELKVIAKARGYHHRWVNHVLAAQTEKSEQAA